MFVSISPHQVADWSAGRLELFAHSATSIATHRLEPSPLLRISTYLFDLCDLLYPLWVERQLVPLLLLHLPELLPLLLPQLPSNAQAKTVHPVHVAVVVVVHEMFQPLQLWSCLRHLPLFLLLDRLTTLQIERMVCFSSCKVREILLVLRIQVGWAMR